MFLFRMFRSLAFLLLVIAALFITCQPAKAQCGSSAVFATSPFISQQSSFQTFSTGFGGSAVVVSPFVSANPLFVNSFAVSPFFSNGFVAGGFNSGVAFAGGRRGIGVAGGGVAIAGGRRGGLAVSGGGANIAINERRGLFGGVRSRSIAVSGNGVALAR